METSIFRKASLERLSSPEQLDTIMRLTGAKRWLALAGMFLILGVAVIWGYEGTIDTKVSGSGVIVRTGTVLNVVTSGTGLVTSINVNLGDRVKADQVVAKVSDMEMLEKIRLARSALEEAKRRGSTIFCCAGKARNSSWTRWRVTKRTHSGKFRNSESR